MGLQVLEREKDVFKVNPNNQPDLALYSYCVERQLKPEARKDIIELLEEVGIIPNAMIILVMDFLQKFFISASHPGWDVMYTRKNFLLIHRLQAPQKIQNQH